MFGVRQFILGVHTWVIGRGLTWMRSDHMGSLPFAPARVYLVLAEMIRVVGTVVVGNFAHLMAVVSIHGLLLYYLAPGGSFAWWRSLGGHRTVV